jgi:hypothetical protein
VTQADFRNGPRHFLRIGQRRQFLLFARHLQVHRAHQAQQRTDEGTRTLRPWPSPGARCRRSGSALRRAGLHHHRIRYAYYKRDPSLESKKDYPSFSKGTGGLKFRSMAFVSADERKTPASPAANRQLSTAPMTQRSPQARFDGLRYQLAAGG